MTHKGWYPIKHDQTKPLSMRPPLFFLMKSKKKLKPFSWVYYVCKWNSVILHQTVELSIDNWQTNASCWLIKILGPVLQNGWVYGLIKIINKNKQTEIMCPWPTPFWYFSIVIIIIWMPVWTSLYELTFKERKKADGSILLLIDVQLNSFSNY